MVGALVIDKPPGITSHDVVRRVRRALNESSVGHLGTLDPMATGVLPLLLGKATRLAQFFLESEKTYEGEICFGFATDTFDKDGQAQGPRLQVQLDLGQIRELARRFTGQIMQTPPQYSAKKVTGIPAYKLARKNLKVELKPVSVNVSKLEILSVKGDRAAFLCRVSAGTYIRSIAHALGQATATGAHLTQLRRIQSGEFGLDRAVTIQELEDRAISLDPGNYIIHPKDLLPSFPSVVADLADQIGIRHGIPVHLLTETDTSWVKVFGSDNELLAIARRVEGTLFQPRVVFDSA